MVTSEVTPLCPGCDEPPSEVSWTTANSQAVCTNDCPVNTWDPSVDLEEATHEVFRGEWNTLWFVCTDAEESKVQYDVDLEWDRCPHCGAKLVGEAVET